MDEQWNSVDAQNLRADIQSLGKQAARPPDAAFCDEASAALGRVYERFVRRVHSFCSRRVLFSLPPGESLESFVTTVFFRFVRSADKVALKADACTATMDRQIMACFHGHALWALRDLIKKPNQIDQFAAAVERDLGVVSSDGDAFSIASVSSNRLRLREELKKVSDRAFDVLMTSYLHWDLVSREFRLPDEVRDELCERCGFKTANALVQYRKRQIESLRSKLASVA